MFDANVSELYCRFFEVDLKTSQIGKMPIFFAQNYGQLIQQIDLYNGKHCGFLLLQKLLRSLEWSHFRISSTDSRLTATLYSIINSMTGQYCSVAFIRMVPKSLLCTDFKVETILSFLANILLYCYECS